MKKKMLLIAIFCLPFLLNIINVKAECTEEEQKQYQEKLEKVRITYIHEDEILDANNEKVNGFFSIKIEGLEEGLALYNPERNLSILGKNEEISKFGFVHGTYEFRLFVANDVCNSANKTLTVKIPKYNSWSDSYLCNDIDSTKFAPCARWYEYDLDEKTFLARLEEYKKSEEEKNKNVIDKVEETVSDMYNDVINHILINWIWYLVGFVIIILIITLAIIKIKKNKKKDSKWK